MTDNPTREQIIETLKALPGVSHKEQVPLQGVKWDTFRTANSYASVTTPEGGSDVIYIDTKNATLAEAVAALTPPDDGPVTREWVEGLGGVPVNRDIYMCFFTGKHDDVLVKFRGDGTIESVSLVFADYGITPPQTRPEFLSMLKLFGIEVVG